MVLYVESTKVTAQDERTDIQVKFDMRILLLLRAVIVRTAFDSIKSRVCQLLIFHRRLCLYRTLYGQPARQPQYYTQTRRVITYTCTLFNLNPPSFTSGIGVITRLVIAISTATAVATVVKNPNTFCRRASVLCISATSFAAGLWYWK